MLTDKVRTCSIEGCTERHKAMNYCNKHYQRFRIHGDATKLMPQGQPKKFETLQENFESRFKKGASNHCWIWTGVLDKDGYGRLSVWVDNGHKAYRSNRLSYEFYVGQLSRESLVCHKCDNPSCVNPYHLFLGTADDNAKDMISKGRSMFGSSNNKAKLTEQGVAEIKAKLSAGAGTTATAREYGVCKSTIGRIKNGSMWKHVK